MGPIEELRRGFLDADEYDEIKRRARAPHTMLALRLGQRGDLTEKLLRRSNRGIPNVPTPIVYRDTLFVPDYSATLPVVSDLALAADSGGTWTRDGQTFLRITPGHVPGPDDVLHLLNRSLPIGVGRRTSAINR